MARRVLLLIGVIIVALLAAVVVLLATSGHEKQVARPEAFDLTGTAVEPTLRAYYNATLTALALVEQATRTAVYGETLSARTQQAVVRETQAAESRIGQAATATGEAITQAAAVDQTQTQQVALAYTLRGTLRATDKTPLPGVGIRLYRDDGDGRFAPFAQDTFLFMATTTGGGEYDFGVLEPGVYWMELAYYSLPAALQAAFTPDTSLNMQAAVPVADPVVFTVQSPFSTPSPTPTLTQTPSPTPTRTPTRTPSSTPTRTPTRTPASSPAATSISSTPTQTVEPTATRTPTTGVTPSASPVATRPALITLTSTPEPGPASFPGTETAVPPDMADSVAIP